MSYVCAADAADDDDERFSRVADSWRIVPGRLYVLDRGVTYSENLHVALFQSSKPVPVHLSFATDLSASPQERVAMSVRACRLCYRICEAARNRLPLRVLENSLAPDDLRKLTNYCILLARAKIPWASTQLQERVCPTWVLRMNGIFQARGVCVFTGTVLIGDVKHIVAFTLGHVGYQWCASDLLLS